jgi:hypothetical protein
MSMAGCGHDFDQPRVKEGLRSCLPRKTHKRPTGVRHRWLTSHAGMLIMEAPMRDDENASSARGKALGAFYSKLPDEDAWLDPLYSLQEPQIEEETEEGRRKAEIWHIFEAW